MRASVPVATEEQMEKLHDAALTLLEGTGMAVHSEQLLRLLEQNGATVDSVAQTIATGLTRDGGQMMIRSRESTCL